MKLFSGRQLAGYAGSAPEARDADSQVMGDVLGNRGC